MKKGEQLKMVSLELENNQAVRNRMPVSLRGGGGELGNLKT
jgi:hypothetical protein